MPSVNHDKEFHQVTLDQVPLEQARDVVAALADYLGVKLERREVFYGEPEYRFIKVK